MPSKQPALRARSAVDEDLAFHRAIAEATGNPEFPRFLQFIGRHLIPRRTVSGLPERMGGQSAYLALIQEEHRRIFDAIAAAIPKAAREAMRRHLTRSLERYRKLAAEQQESRLKILLTHSPEALRALLRPARARRAAGARRGDSCTSGRDAARRRGA